jgi:hypothetical protein
MLFSIYFKKILGNGTDVLSFFMSDFLPYLPHLISNFKY